MATQEPLMGPVSNEFRDLVQRGYRFALSLTHDAERAEELVQDAWFAVLRRQGPWNRGYLFTTIRNRFIDRYRRSGVFSPGPLDAEAVEAPVQPERDLLVADRIELSNGALGPALGNLSAEERAVLYLAGVEDFSAQGIADLLHWPRGTVLGVMRRAKTKLRRTIENGSKP
jgi:RNA polymerase sigma-70 factor (ECF subfamily)